MALQYAVGDVLGNYNLVEKIGEGSMGTVYKAAHWRSNEVVAIKVMPSHIARKSSLLKRFEQEFRLASKVNHPNVVRSLEYNGAGTEPYLVMEYVDGVSIGERIEKQGAMPEEEAVNIIAQVTEGLQHAHRLGLLHRDVKPDNIIVTRDGAAKLADLGLAKEMDGAEELTREGSGFGTPNFMAPEQFRNAKHVDVRADVYSLGATLYQMITGELPYGHGDPVRMLMRKIKGDLTPVRQYAPRVSERTELAICRAMRAEAEQRQASCEEFLDELLGRAPKAPKTDLPRDSGLLRRPAEVRKTDAVSRAAIEAHLAESLANLSPPPVPLVDPTSTPAPMPNPRATPMPGMMLQSARYLPPAEPVQPPAPERTLPDAPAEVSLTGWKTALLILVTCVGTLLVSQLVFGLLK